MTKAILEQSLEDAKEEIKELKNNIKSLESEIKSLESGKEEKGEIFNSVLAKYGYYLAIFKFLKEVLKTKKFKQLFEAVELESKKEIKKAIKSFETISEQRDQEIKNLIDLELQRYKESYEEIG